MSSSDFVAYIGVPDMHDGEVLSISRTDKDATVRVRGYSGQEYEVHFEDVQAIEMFEPEGMDLYAISEMRVQPPLRRFDFANNSEEDHKRLSIIAKGFRFVTENR